MRDGSARTVSNSRNRRMAMAAMIVLTVVGVILVGIWRILAVTPAPHGAEPLPGRSFTNRVVKNL